MSKKVSTTFQRAIQNWLSTVLFPKHKDRFRAISEKVLYDRLASKDIYDQHVGNAKEFVEVKFLHPWDDEWHYVCDIHSNMSESKAEAEVLNGLQIIKRRIEKEFERKHGKEANVIS